MEFHEIEDGQPAEKKIAIYSKTAIVCFSVLFSPIAGGVLLMLNLRSAGYKREGTSVLLFTIAYKIITTVILSNVVKLPENATAQDIVSNVQLVIYTLALNILGGAILSEYFFRKYFSADNYDRKSVWPPFFIIILIFILLNKLLGVY